MESTSVLRENVSVVVKLERSSDVQLVILKFIRPEVNNGTETDVASAS